MPRLPEFTSRVSLPAGPPGGYPPPGRLLVAPALEGASDAAHVLLLRYAADEPWSLLSLPVDQATSLALEGEREATAVEAALTATLELTLASRFGLTVAATPQLAAERLPVLLPDPLRGHSGLGWLYPVLVPVRPLNHGAPWADPLVEAVEAFPADEAARLLPTDLERRALALALEAGGRAAG